MDDYLLSWRQVVQIAPLSKCDVVYSTTKQIVPVSFLAQGVEYIDATQIVVVQHRQSPTGDLWLQEPEHAASKSYLLMLPLKLNYSIELEIQFLNDEMLRFRCRRRNARIRGNRFRRRKLYLVIMLLQERIMLLLVFPIHPAVVNRFMKEVRIWRPELMLRLRRMWILLGRLLRGRALSALVKMRGKYFSRSRGTKKEHPTGWFAQTGKQIRSEKGVDDSFF